ncbi:hypothetical protein, partial [Mesorhizobium sp. M1A.F.Ca.IN.022.07.1.1]|uniref:hypothetical protein n=1 Tax=Mesorhizobium sp. M1A.F.Ca.IN.022.07.1.1 TaxID=2496767 RepID=UPI0019D06035
VGHAQSFSWQRGPYHLKAAVANPKPSGLIAKQCKARDENTGENARNPKLALAAGRTAPYSSALR